MKLIRGEPDITGRVWSMAAIDLPKPTLNPYCTLGLHVEEHSAKPSVPENEWPLLYFDLTKQGAETVAAIVAAAYVAQTKIDVFLEDPKDMFVKSIQATKPPKAK